jgi:hypothetical protein
MQDKVPLIHHTRDEETSFNLSMLKDLSLQPMAPKVPKENAMELIKDLLSNAKELVNITTQLKQLAKELICMVTQLRHPLDSLPIPRNEPIQFSFNPNK